MAARRKLFGRKSNHIIISGANNRRKALRVSVVPKLYYVLYETQPTAPTGPEIVNRTFSSGIHYFDAPQPSSSGDFSFPSINLEQYGDPTSSYKLSYVWFDGTNYSNVTTTDTFVASPVPVLSNLVINNITSTIDVLVDVTTRITSGSYYLVVYPSDQGTNIDAAKIISGLDPGNNAAVIAVSTSGPGISQSGQTLLFDNLSGLSSGETYYAALVWSNGVDQSNFLLSNTFTLAAINELSADPKSITVTGVANEFRRNLTFVADAKPVVVNGLSADTSTQRLLVADSKSVVVTGVANQFVRNANLVADARSITVTGVANEFRRNLTFVADAKPVVVTGVANEFRRNLTFVADSKSILVNGIANEFLLGNSLIADAGNITVTGISNQFQANRNLVADSKSISVVGFSNDFIVTRSLQADSKSIVATGFGNEFVRALILVAEDKSVVVNGIEAELDVIKLIVADPFSVEVNGFEATFIGSYVYPDPAFVKYGLRYGPSGKDFTGQFLFAPSFDIVEGTIVTQSNNVMLGVIDDSENIVLSPDEVRLGVPFGSSGQFGTSIGFNSYDPDTGAIFKPLSSNKLLVI